MNRRTVFLMTKSGEQCENVPFDEFMDAYDQFIKSNNFISKEICEKLCRCWKHWCYNDSPHFDIITKQLLMLERNVQVMVLLTYVTYVDKSLIYIDELLPLNDGSAESLICMSNLLLTAQENGMFQNMLCKLNAIVYLQQFITEKTSLDLQIQENLCNFCVAAIVYNQKLAVAYFSFICSETFLKQPLLSPLLFQLGRLFSFFSEDKCLKCLILQKFYVFSNLLIDFIFFGLQQDYQQNAKATIYFLESFAEFLDDEDDQLSEMDIKLIQNLNYELIYRIIKMIFVLDKFDAIKLAFFQLRIIESIRTSFQMFDRIIISQIYNHASVLIDNLFIDACCQLLTNHKREQMIVVFNCLCYLNISCILFGQNTYLSNAVFELENILENLAEISFFQTHSISLLNFIYKE